MKKSLSIQTKRTAEQIARDEFEKNSLEMYQKIRSTFQTVAKTEQEPAKGRLVKLEDTIKDSSLRDALKKSAIYQALSLCGGVYIDPNNHHMDKHHSGSEQEYYSQIARTFLKSARLDIEQATQESETDKMSMTLKKVGAVTPSETHQTLKITVMNPRGNVANQMDTRSGFRIKTFYPDKSVPKAGNPHLVGKNYTHVTQLMSQSNANKASFY